MAVRMKRPGKRVLALLGILAVFAAGCIGFTGCRGGSGDTEKIRDLEFTVTGEGEVPQALAELIGKKREKPFKLTYADGQDMYIVIGEGPQTGGGYSITVKELYLTENSVVIRTELLGPEKGEATGTDPSYPVLIVKTGRVPASGKLGRRDACPPGRMEAFGRKLLYRGRIFW